MKRVKTIVVSISLLLSAVLISLPVLIYAQDSGDYGDAPEGVRAYINGTIGSFPTCIQVGPASSYVYHQAPTGMPFVLLGDDSEGLAPTPFDWDAETDGLCDQSILGGVNCGATVGDEWYKGVPSYPPKTDPDAGVPGNYIPGCYPAYLKDVQVCLTTTAGSDTTVYFNALFDWNQDGDWNDVFTCYTVGDAPEHGIVDYPVTILTGANCVIVDIPFSYYPGPSADKQNFWMRATVTPSQITGGVSGWDGSGELPDGESEDYFYQPTVYPEVDTECPATYTTCPEWPTWCPDDPTFCPKIYTTCPADEFTICPEIPTECPPSQPPTECPLGTTYCPDPPTMCVVEPTWCPELPTECPVDPFFTYCPENPTECPQEQTFCPMVETSCPVIPTICPVDTVCPETYTACSVIPTECPEFQTECPAEPTECTIDETHCPLIETTCPVISTQCPQVPITVCPVIATECPEVYTECPEAETICPEEWPTWCPDDLTFCPKIYTTCPADEFTICPDIPTECPPSQPPTECPLGTTYCPADPTDCPIEPTWCPPMPTECPEMPEFTYCPLNDTMCPVTPTACPLNWTFCPEIPTVCPETQTECPEVPTECPETVTECSQEPTECPIDPTFCPALTTECPMETTQCPVDPTTCPTSVTECAGGAATTCPTRVTECTGTLTTCPYDETSCAGSTTYCPVNPTYCPLIDTDHDGVIDCYDTCPLTPNGTILGVCATRVKPNLAIIDRTTTCTADGDCGTGLPPDFCEKGQLDTNLNGCGDACECEGDFNLSGGVDGVDFNNPNGFLPDWLRKDCPPPPGPPPCEGDFDVSGAVDGVDFIKFLEDWLRKDCCVECPYLYGGSCP